MIVQVEYSVPVLAQVDTDTGEVVRVIVVDEDVRPANGDPLWTEDGEPINWRNQVTARACAIAGGEVWPGWEIGL